MDAKGVKMHALTPITQGGAASTTTSPTGILQNKKPWRPGKQQGGQQKRWGRTQQQRSQGAGKGSGNGKGQRCSNCGGFGHAARQCPTPRKSQQQGSQQQSGLRVIQCQRCQRWGHYARDFRAPVPNRMSALCDSALVSSLEQLALGPEIALLQTRQHWLQGLGPLDIEMWPITMPYEMEEQDGVIYGSHGDGVIYGNHSDGVIYGNHSDGVIYGNHGDDVLYGNNGDGVINSNHGDDIHYNNIGEPYVFQDHGPGWMPGDFRASRAAPAGPRQRCRCTISRVDSTGSVNTEPVILLGS